MAPIVRPGAMPLMGETVVERAAKPSPAPCRRAPRDP